jgi:formamidopyrimidine-DNA glycosylase
MPELPEVETVVTTLRPRITGATIAGAVLYRTDIITPAGIDLTSLLLGRQIISVDRRAKRIVLTLDDCNRFYIHLGMTGRLTLEPPDAPLQPHTHFILNLQGHAQQVRFRDPRRFGGIFWLGQASADGDLGPEPLTLRAEELANLLKKTRRPIKSALLDQTLIAGLGNIYADECLFLSGIHPLTLANRLSRQRVSSLNRAIKLTLRQAIKAKGSTLRDYVNADNTPGTYRSRHKVYDRSGQACVRCRTTIKRIVLTGRSTCFCPICQTRK